MSVYKFELFSGNELVTKQDNASHARSCVESCRVDSMTFEYEHPIDGRIMQSHYKTRDEVLGLFDTLSREF